MMGGPSATSTPAATIRNAKTRQIGEGPRLTLMFAISVARLLKGAGHLSLG
jgi:hypothetical protein